MWSITCNYKDGTEKITFEDIGESGVLNSLKAQKNKPEQECSDLFQSGEAFDVKGELSISSKLTVFACDL